MKRRAHSLWLACMIYVATMSLVQGAQPPEQSPTTAPIASSLSEPAASPEPEKPHTAPAADAEPGTQTNAKPHPIYDLSALPAPVAATREALLAAAKSADLENFRPLLNGLDTPLHFSFGGEDDPIAFWRENTGDQDGLELMAIMIEILNQGYVHLDQGTDHEVYVWPYFFGASLNELNNKQLVELYTLITPQDAEDMKNFGNYIFYRLGISPDGQWRFMVAGD